MKAPDIARRIQAAELDAVVAFSMENVYYLSGVALLTQRLIPSRLAMVVWTASDEATIVVCAIEEAQVKAESRISDVMGYVEFADSPVAALAEALAHHGLSEARIGLESEAIAHPSYVELCGLLPGATFLGADAIFNDARMVKTREEIEMMSHAARVTELAIHATFEEASAGDSEAQLADRMESRIRGPGAGIAFTILATGANARLVHPSPGGTPLSKGSIVRTDFGGYFGARHAGYMSDLARTGVVSPSDTRQEDTYKKLVDVHQELIGSLRPGVRASDVYGHCRNAFEARHMVFTMPHVGHGIGVSVHEPPILSPQSSQELLPGMVLAIEPITMGHDGIYHVEDMVEITETGARVLSSGHDWSSLRVIA